MRFRPAGMTVLALLVTVDVPAVWAASRARTRTLDIARLPPAGRGGSGVGDLKARGEHFAGLLLGAAAVLTLFGVRLVRR